MGRIPVPTMHTTWQTKNNENEHIWQISDSPIKAAYHPKPFVLAFTKGPHPLFQTDDLRANTTKLPTLCNALHPILDGLGQRTCSIGNGPRYTLEKQTLIMSRWEEGTLSCMHTLLFRARTESYSLSAVAHPMPSPFNDKPHTNKIGIIAPGSSTAPPISNRFARCHMR